MIYLSQLFLDPLSRQVQRELVSPYEMHRTLCHAFPNLSTDEFRAARVLFRVDDDKGAPYALVQSKVAPDWEAFRSHVNGKRYLLATPRQKSMQLQFEAGQKLRFRLFANPTYRPFVARDVRTQKNIERVGLYREHERLDWLLQRGKECGFGFATQEVTLQAGTNPDGSPKPIYFRGPKNEPTLALELPIVEVVDLNDGRRFPLPNQKHQFSAARFDGILQITEAEKFLAALENGIGPAKGYGFGLLSLARA